jgi:DNA repair protein RadD
MSACVHSVLVDVARFRERKKSYAWGFVLLDKPGSVVLLTELHKKPTEFIVLNELNNLTLRPYQVTDIERLRGEYATGKRAVIYQLATGGGKTVVFSKVISSAVDKGKKVAVVCHRRELINQASDKLTWCGVAHGIQAAGLDRDHDAPVQVCSIQSIINRLETLPQFDFIVLDECHHAVAATWAAFLLSQPKAKILGVSATPVRLDGKGLGSHCGGFFDSIVCGPAVTELTTLGYLAPVVVYDGHKIDVSGLRKVAGDWAGGDELAKRASVVTGDAVAEYARHCAAPQMESDARQGIAKPSGGAQGAAMRSALCFCVTVAHAQEVAAAFREAGYRAAMVSGATPKIERDDLLAAIGDGRLDVLTSCELISEGLDVPSVGAVILLRPTASLAMARQQVGRGMRPKADGSPLIVLDHAGNIDRHGDVDEPIEWNLDGAIRHPKPKALPNPETVGMGTPRQIEYVAGELALREKAAAEQARWARMSYTAFKKVRRSEVQVRAYGKAHGYKSGWCWYFMQDQALRCGHGAAMEDQEAA